MKTVTLHGAKAAGRVALVDDEDYDLVMQYRWRVTERAGTETTRPLGPYAITRFPKPDGRRGQMQMHRLITGWSLTDHKDHDGLNNQRSNLRRATTSQNGANKRRRTDARSQFKGITWDSRDRMFKARIETFGNARTVSASPIEIEAAYGYDAAARELFGPFACVNFPEGPTRAMRDQWQAEREVRAAVIAAEEYARKKARKDAWWAKREYKTYTCEFCGNEFQSRSTQVPRYCHINCRAAVSRQRRREAQQRRDAA